MAFRRNPPQDFRDLAPKPPSLRSDLLVFLVLFLLSFSMVVVWGREGGQYVKTVSSGVALGVTSVLDAGWQGISGLFASARELAGSREELQNLRDENQRLRGEYNKVLQELELLRKDRPPREEIQQTYSLTAARVTGRLNAPFKSIIVDKGTRDGLRMRMPAVTEDGFLIGRIEAILPHASQILLITDQNSRVAAEVERVGLVDLARGTSQGAPSIVFTYQRVNPVPGEPGAEIGEGDRVVTSGLSSIFPPGLLIGEILEEPGDDPRIRKELAMKPAAPLEDLRKVWILTGLALEDARTLLETGDAVAGGTSE